MIGTLLNTRFNYHKVIQFFLILNFTISCAQMKSEDEFSKLRENMVLQQIKGRGVTNKAVLDAMMKVKRHEFVPDELKTEAYNDHPLPIGEGQTISQPYIVALMTELLIPDPSGKILEVGTGSGYQAAILAETFEEVYSIEIKEKLYKQAKLTLNRLHYNNIHVKHGDGYKGWYDKSPFDGIIVTCSPTHVPDSLASQLIEGGRMVIPVGHRFAQELVLLIKKNGILKQQEIIPVRFVPMIDEEGKTY